MVKEKVKHYHKMALPLKERKFLRQYFKTLEGEKSALKVYNCKNKASASAIASELLAKPRIQEAFIMLLDKAGLSDEKLAKVLKQGLKARETRFFADKGKVTDERVTIDYNARHKYLETALKTKKLLPQSGSEDNPIHTKGLVMMLPPRAG